VPICCAFLLIYGALAMDSSKIAASGASRLAEILPAKVNKASLTLNLFMDKSLTVKEKQFYFFRKWTE
jgi:hypothetical protein